MRGSDEHLLGCVAVRTISWNRPSLVEGMALPHRHLFAAGAAAYGPARLLFRPGFTRFMNAQVASGLRPSASAGPGFYVFVSAFDAMPPLISDECPGNSRALGSI